jgi:UDP-2-acetamido-3-amino-2,3-dideoxy-glucuronate N-acetyltransferase
MPEVHGAGAGGAGTPPPAFIHPTAIVDEGAVVEPGAKVWHFVHVCKGARVGAGCSLGQNVYVGPGVSIGRGCKIQNNVSVYEGVTLEDEVFVGPSAVFTNVRTPRAHVNRRHEFAPTLVRRRATIGANATIVCGVTLAEGAFVAAGSVVTRDVPPYVLVQGVPARPAGHACACGEMLRGTRSAGAQVACSACGSVWAVRSNGGLAPAAGRPA